MLLCKVAISRVSHLSESFTLISFFIHYYVDLLIIEQSENMAIIQFNQDNQLVINPESANESKMWLNMFYEVNNIDLKSATQGHLSIKYVAEPQYVRLELQKSSPIIYSDLEKIIEKFCHGYVVQSPEDITKAYQRYHEKNRVFVPEEKPIISFYFNEDDELIVKLFLGQKSKQSLFQELYRRVNTCLKKRYPNHSVVFENQISFFINQVSKIDNIGRMLSKALKISNIVEGITGMEAIEKKITRLGIKSLMEHESRMLQKIDVQDANNHLYRFQAQVRTIMELFQCIIDSECDLNKLSKEQKKVLQKGVQMLKPFDNLPPVISVGFTKLRTRFSYEVHKKLGI